MISFWVISHVGDGNRKKEISKQTKQTNKNQNTNAKRIFFFIFYKTLPTYTSRPVNKQMNSQSTLSVGLFYKNSEPTKEQKNTLTKESFNEHDVYQPIEQMVENNENGKVTVYFVNNKYRINTFNSCAFFPDKRGMIL